MKLHEKKVSELDIQQVSVEEIDVSEKMLNVEANKKMYGDGYYNVEKEAILLDDLKEWAVAIVNNCYFNIDEYTHCTKDGRCAKCKFLIEKFELTEEDLK